MGPKDDHVLASFKFDAADDADKFDVILQKFNSYFIPKRNMTYERAQFHCRQQKDGETVKGFVRVLYNLAEHCGFGETKEEQIKDRIVTGIADPVVSQKLQLKTNPTLNKAIETVRNTELVKSQNGHSQSHSATAKNSLDAVSQRWTTQQQKKRFRITQRVQRTPEPGQTGPGLGLWQLWIQTRERQGTLSSTAQ